MGMKNKSINLLSSGRNQAYKLDSTVSIGCVIKVKICSDFKYSSHISFFKLSQWCVKDTINNFDTPISKYSKSELYTKGYKST